jgi:hypothetical protein
MTPRLGSALLAALAVFHPSVASAACLTSSDTGQLTERLEAAEAAFAALDAEGFGRALDDATLLVPCLSDVPPRALAARMHRLDGLRQFAAGDNESALASMQAARVLDPTYRFPDETLPADHALRVAYEALPTDEGDSVRPPQPTDGVLVFDGVEQPRRPIDRATLFQLVEDGSVASTRMLSPDEDLPAYRAKPRARNRLLVGSGVMLGLSGLFYGLAWAANDQFWGTTDDGATISDYESLQAQSRTYTALSATSLGLGVGGVVLAFTVADGSGRR